MSYDSEVEENLALNRIIASLKKELYSYRKRESVVLPKTTEFETTREELFSMSKRLRDAEEDIISFRHPVLQGSHPARKDRTPNISKIEIIEEVFRTNRTPGRPREEGSYNRVPLMPSQDRSNLPQHRRPEASSERLGRESHMLSREGSRRVLREYKEDAEPRQSKERELVHDKKSLEQRDLIGRVPHASRENQADIKRINRLDQQVLRVVTKITSMFNRFSFGSKKCEFVHKNSEDLSCSLEEIEKKIKAFLKEFEDERQSMQTKLKKLESAAEQDKSALKILVKENEELQMSVEKRQSRKGSVQHQDSERRKSISISQSGNEESLRAELSNIESLCQQQNILIAKYKEALKRAKEDAAQQQAKLVSEQMLGLQSTNQRANEELEMAHREIRKMKTSIQDLEHSNHELKQQMEELQRNMHPMKKELETQRMKVETLENIIEITNAENASLRIRGKEEDTSLKIFAGQGSQKKVITGGYVTGASSTKKMKSLIGEDNLKPSTAKRIDEHSIDLTDQEECHAEETFEGITVGRITGSMQFKFKDDDFQSLLTNREFRLEPVSQHIQTHYSSHFNPKSTQSTSLPPRTVAKEFEQELEEFRRMEVERPEDTHGHKAQNSASAEFKSANLFRNEISDSFGKHN